MSVLGKNRHYRWNEIQCRHWLETAKRCGFGEMRAVIESVISQTPDVIKKVQGVVPKGFHIQIADSILGGIKQSAARLKQELAAI